MTIHRVADADYGEPGYYHVTTVTAGRKAALAHLSSHGALPTTIGNVVLEHWKQLPIHWPWLTCVAFSLMPDHVHCIVSWATRPPGRVKLGHVVGGFKAGVTRAAREGRLLRADEVLWQRGYDVRFLKSERRLRIAVQYVEDNWRREWARAQRPQ
jgi:REP element-mobilizing transposase RayT